MSEKDKDPNDKQRNASKRRAEKLRRDIDHKSYEFSQMAENIRVAMMEDDEELVAMFKDELKRISAERENMEDLLEHMETDNNS